MIALGTKVVETFVKSRSYSGRNGYFRVTDTQYAILVDGRTAQRYRTDDPNQRRATMSWTKWRISPATREEVIAMPEYVNKVVS